MPACTLAYCARPQGEPGHGGEASGEPGHGLRAGGSRATGCGPRLQGGLRGRRQSLRWVTGSGRARGEQDAGGTEALPGRQVMTEPRQDREQLGERRGRAWERRAAGDPGKRGGGVDRGGRGRRGGRGALTVDSRTWL